MIVHLNMSFNRIRRHWRPEDASWSQIKNLSREAMKRLEMRERGERKDVAKGCLGGVPYEYLRVSQRVTNILHGCRLSNRTCDIITSGSNCVLKEGVGYVFSRRALHVELEAQSKPLDLSSRKRRENDPSRKQEYTSTAYSTCCVPTNGMEESQHKCGLHEDVCGCGC